MGLHRAVIADARRSSRPHQIEFDILGEVGAGACPATRCASDWTSRNGVPVGPLFERDTATRQIHGSGDTGG
jgi:hypothetical protein